MHEGVRRAGFADTMIYLQLTRGPAPRNHAHPDQYEPTVVLTFKAKPVVSAEKRAAGLSLMTLPDFRWSRCDVKSIALLPNIMAKNEALANGYDDAVFIGPEGDVREASAANLFIIQSGHLLTRQEDRTILPGITRKLILSCAAQMELPTREARILKDELMSADEVFVCSSAIEVVSVVRVDDQPIGDGRPGPLTARLYDHIRKELGIGDRG
jgi:D-alanine transaminase